MMHNVEVPVVMRQTIKCARLFFKLVDFKKLKLHSLPSSINEPAQNEGQTENDKKTESVLTSV